MKITIFASRLFLGSFLILSSLKASQCQIEDQKNILNFSEEITLGIFSQLVDSRDPISSVKSLVTLSEVCRPWNRISKDTTLWKPFFERDDVYEDVRKNPVLRSQIAYAFSILKMKDAGKKVQLLMNLFSQNPVCENLRLFDSLSSKWARFNLVLSLNAIPPLSRSKSQTAALVEEMKSVCLHPLDQEAKEKVLMLAADSSFDELSRVSLTVQDLRAAYLEHMYSIFSVKIENLIEVFGPVKIRLSENPENVRHLEMLEGQILSLRRTLEGLKEEGTQRTEDDFQLAREEILKIVEMLENRTKLVESLKGL